jgi:hypothetical protein
MAHKPPSKKINSTAAPPRRSRNLAQMMSTVRNFKFAKQTREHPFPPFRVSGGFRMTTPAPRHMLQVCRAESCQSAGCEVLVAHLEQRLGIKIGASTPDGSITLSPIYCLGNCTHSPAVLLDGEPWGCVTPEIADSLINDVLRRQ